MHSLLCFVLGCSWEACIVGAMSFLLSAVATFRDRKWNCFGIVRHLGWSLGIYCHVLWQCCPAGLAAFAWGGGGVWYRLLFAWFISLEYIQIPPGILRLHIPVRYLLCLFIFYYIHERVLMFSFFQEYFELCFIRKQYMGQAAVLSCFNLF